MSLGIPWFALRLGINLEFGLTLWEAIPYAMGGIFGLIASLGILALWYFFSKRIIPLAAVGLALALDQGLKIILEVFLQRFYSAGMFDLLITVLQIISVALLAIYFARKQRLVVIR